MRAFAWGCFVAGILLAIAAFVITANTIQNPWPALMAGFCLSALAFSCWPSIGISGRRRALTTTTAIDSFHDQL